MSRPVIPDLAYESALWASGRPRVAGVDEVGRGCLAGPVFAAAVSLWPGRPAPRGVRDSKALTPAARAALVGPITEGVRAWALGAASAHEIDTIGISPATHLAMLRALRRLGGHDHVLLDGNPVKGFEALIGPYTALVKGDARVASIAAASVLAKVARDHLLELLDARHPGYGWDHNAGYGTPEHLSALVSLGATAHHRMSFAPLRQVP